MSFEILMEPKYRICVPRTVFGVAPTFLENVFICWTNNLFLNYIRQFDILIVWKRSVFVRKITVA